jgi:hypothetical protein
LLFHFQLSETCGTLDISGRWFYTSNAVERRLAVIQRVFLLKVSCLHPFESPVDVLHDCLLLGVEFRCNHISLCLIMLVFFFSAEVVDLVLERAITFNG